MTNAVRRAATANHRKRAVAKGLSRVEVQVPSIDAPLLRELAQVLRIGDAHADAVRKTIRAKLPNDGPKTALEIYASDLPDEYFESVFDHERKVEDREIDL